ncbi:MAG TPA: polysaccharide biosynthesis/export family protein [Blastocatellia bacterium]|nr:polysaccharide biosynthesis/export family protein [Blastocatellia bacterium]
MRIGNRLLRSVFVVLMAAMVSLVSSGATAQTAQNGGGTVAVAVDENEDQYFKTIYRHFFETYKLGPEDELAIRVLGQPDYSVEKARVSPVGRIYHPLLGDVEVVGLTVDRLTNKLRTELGEYIIDPKVSVSLLEARSAKIGVLGDVNSPGIVVMDRPMTLLDAISAAGGVTDRGSKSNITVHRKRGGDRIYKLKLDLKKVLDGKAGPEENITLAAGDTVIVHGNWKKTWSVVTSMLGFGRFLTYVAGR